MQNISYISEVTFYDAGFEPTHAQVRPRPFHSFSFRKSGCVVIGTEKGALTSLAGSVTYIPAGCGYKTDITEAGEMYVMHLAVEEGGLPFGDAPRVLTPEDPQKIVHLFRCALRHSLTVNGEYAVMADAYSLLSEMQRLFEGEKAAPNTRMLACKQYLDEHIAQPALRVSTLAQMYFTSEVQFRADFRRAYGEAPITYIKRRRIEIAKSLLESGLYSVAEVALRSGFDSISYFSSEFRRLTGVSPREYGLLL